MPARKQLRRAVVRHRLHRPRPSGIPKALRSTPRGQHGVHHHPGDGDVQPDGQSEARNLAMLRKRPLREKKNVVSTIGSATTDRVMWLIRMPR